MILAILVSIQHSRVPTFNLAENSYFGLAAGKGLSPFWEKVYLTYNEYFYFYFIPVISTTISGFLFTRQFRRYAILRVKPSAYRIPFFRTSS
jgi:hypothetical protein